MEEIGYSSPDSTTLMKIYDLPNSRWLNSMVQSKIILVAFKAARLALLIVKISLADYIISTIIVWVLISILEVQIQGRWTLLKSGGASSN